MIRGQIGWWLVNKLLKALLDQQPSDDKWAREEGRNSKRFASGVSEALVSK